MSWFLNGAICMFLRRALVRVSAVVLSVSVVMACSRQGKVSVKPSVFVEAPAPEGSAREESTPFPSVPTETPVPSVPTYGPMSLAITSPNGGADTYTDESSPVLSGTCSANVTSLTMSVAPSALFSNNCATNGTWQVTAPLGWKAETFSVTGADGSGSTVSDSIKITRAVILGKSSYSEADSGSGTLGYYSGTPAMRVWTDGTKLAIVDPPRNRVLLFNSLPSTPQALPDVVLGQVALNKSSAGCTAATLSYPRGVFFDGTRLWVADGSNHRVLAYTGWPSAHGAAASLVLGQPNFETCASATTASGLKTPSSVWSNATDVVAVADSGNNRALLWTGGIPNSSAAANRVLGQATFNVGTSNRGLAMAANSLSGPRCVGSDGTRFFVCDTSNQRFLIWETLPDQDGKNADRVLGGSSMATLSSAVDVRIRQPSAYAIDGSHLYISDVTDHVVRRFDDYTSIASGTAATLAIGQNAFSDVEKPNCGQTSATAGCVRFPDGIAIGGGKLFVGDFGNARVMVWNTADLSTNGVAATSLYGRVDLLKGAQYVAAGLPLNGASSVAVSATRMAVVDRSNKRVLLYNSIPTTPYETPSVVLGQDSRIESKSYAVAQNSLPDPFGVATDGTRLFVSDYANNRILIWTTWPTLNNQNADFVFGQGVFTANSAATTQSGLRNPAGLALFGDKLAVADSGNNRVLVFDVVTVNANQKNAELVLGQLNFSSGAANRGGVAAQNTLKGPYAVTLSASTIAVADSGNNRVLYWSSWPGNGAVANFVLGQADFVSATANRGGGTTASLSTLSGPKGVAFLGSKLFVGDSDNNRILGWNDVSSISNGIAADFSLGHFTGNESASGFALAGVLGVTGNGTKLAAVSSSGVLMWNTAPSAQATAPDFASPLGLINADNGDVTATQISDKWIRTQLVGGKFYVNDRYNNRILGYNSLPERNNATPDFVLGQPSFTTNAINSGGLNGRVFNSPISVFFVSGRFLVADNQNNRILIWNTPPTSANADPDIVLGQPNFFTNLPNIGPGWKSLNKPDTIAVIGNKLVVSEYSNNRFLIWNDIDAITTNFQAADLVLGQMNENATQIYQGGSAAPGNMKWPGWFCNDDTRILWPNFRDSYFGVWNVADPGLVNGAIPDVLLNSSFAAPSQIDFGKIQSCAVSPSGKLFLVDNSALRMYSWASVASFLLASPPVSTWGEAPVVSGVFSGSYSPTSFGLQTVYAPQEAPYQDILILTEGIGGGAGLASSRILIIPAPN